MYAEDTVLYLLIVLIGFNINDCCNRVFSLWPLRLCLVEAAFVMATSAFGLAASVFDWPLWPLIGCFGLLIGRFGL